jgi:acyl carrier protein
MAMDEAWSMTSSRGAWEPDNALSGMTPNISPFPVLLLGLFGADHGVLVLRGGSLVANLFQRDRNAGRALFGGALFSPARPRASCQGGSIGARLTGMRVMESMMDEIESRVVECFANVFPSLSREQLPRVSQSSVAEWDSVHHVILLAALAEEFQFEVDYEAAEELRSFALVVDHVRNRP